MPNEGARTDVGHCYNKSASGVTNDIETVPIKKRLTRNTIEEPPVVSFVKT
jgi:hypothetical protein